jgi:hypothetical protein
METKVIIKFGERRSGSKKGNTHSYWKIKKNKIKILNFLNIGVAQG